MLGAPLVELGEIIKEEGAKIMRSLTPVMVVLALLVGLASMSLFTVYETDKALVVRLGKFKGQTSGTADILDPGLHFKIPFIDTVHKFDGRLQMLDFHSSSILTSEKKDVQVDLFVQWKIRNFGDYYTSTGGLTSKAGKLLSQVVVDGLRAEIGKLTIRDLVSGERVDLMSRLRDQLDNNVQRFGIQVKDVRIKRIDLPDEVHNAVFDRMRTERERIASNYRAQGGAEANKIRANAERRVRVMIAEAEKQAETIRGQGDAEAVKVYARTYNEAPEFFEFYRSIEAYKRSFQGKDDILVLKPEGDFFKYFHQMEH